MKKLFITVAVLLMAAGAAGGDGGAKGNVQAKSQGVPQDPLVAANNSDGRPMAGEPAVESELLVSFETGIRTKPPSRFATKGGKRGGRNRWPTPPTGVANRHEGRTSHRCHARSRR